MRGVGFLSTLFVALALFVAAPSEGRRLVGDRVPFTGTVTDSSGRAIADLTVVVELRRRGFRLLRMRRETSEPVQIVTRTDADGRWNLDWAWDGHHNHFTVSWGLPSDRPDRPLEVLESRDVTQAVDAGGPVIADLTLVDSEWTRWVSRYLSGDATEDEERVFRERGRPDRTESLGTPGEEIAWFYFAVGRAYRFADGRLQGVDSFEPVPPADD